MLPGTKTIPRNTGHSEARNSHLAGRLPPGVLPEQTRNRCREMSGSAGVDMYAVHRHVRERRGRYVCGASGMFGVAGVDMYAVQRGHRLSGIDMYTVQRDVRRRRSRYVCSAERPPALRNRYVYSAEGCPASPESICMQCREATGSQESICMQCRGMSGAAGGDMYAVQRGHRLHRNDIGDIFIYFLLMTISNRGRYPCAPAPTRQVLLPGADHFLCSGHRVD